MRPLPALLALVLLATPAVGVAVDSTGCTIHSPRRSATAKLAFRHDHPCPATGRTRGACRGWEIDHVVPLCCGGADAPSNMRWLTRSQHRARHARGIDCSQR